MYERGVRRRALAAAGLASVLWLSACGGGSDPEAPHPPLATASDIAAGAAQPGPTPFISFVPLSGQSLKAVSAVRFVIEPKVGAASRAVDVTYTTAALERRGYLVVGSSVATLPVFGLYAGRPNRVTVQLQFNDGSRRDLSVDITAPAYTDPNGIYDRPNILKARAPGSELGFDYFFMKSAFAGPVVVDTDGEVRWVAPAPMNAQSSTFSDNGFVVGEPDSVKFHRIELDGRTSTSALIAPNYTNFHHNIDRGKFGLLGEVDAVSGGVPNIESMLAEFSPSGAVLKEWDFADILARYMRSQGDDPAAFIRSGVDWFHMNAATYDPRDDSIIVSSRENFVIKVDYRTGDLKWILGDPTKYWYSFPSLQVKALRLEEGGLYPIGQHSTSITSDGLLMVFNNGAASINQPTGVPVGEARSYSAVSGYDIDPVAMTAREALRFDYGQSILSDVCSSVYEAQKTGSLLASYAVAEGRTKARLVGLNISRAVVFDFEYESQPCAASWNAEAITLHGMGLSL